MFTFQEAYGHLPKCLWRTIRQCNVSPADYMMLQFQFGEDWDRIQDFIKANTVGACFIYPFGGIV